MFSDSYRWRYLDFTARARPRSLQLLSWRRSQAAGPRCGCAAARSLWENKRSEKFERSHKLVSLDDPHHSLFFIVLLFVRREMTLQWRTDGVEPSQRKRRMQRWNCFCGSSCFPFGVQRGAPGAVSSRSSGEVSTGANVIALRPPNSARKLSELKFSRPVRYTHQVTLTLSRKSDGASQ